MTEQQIDRERLRENAAEGGPWGAVVLALLDQLDQADARIARLTAQTETRRRAVAIYQQRAVEAEARIKAVRDMHTAVKLGEHSGSFISAPDDHLVCAHCTDPDAGGYMDYPCETLRALDGER